MWMKIIGWALRSMEDDRSLGIAPLLDAVIEHIPPPTVAPGPFSMLYVDQIVHAYFLFLTVSFQDHQS